MAEFTIAIAGTTASVTGLFDSTRHYCTRYLTQDPPEYFLTVQREELAAEQQLLLEEAMREGIRPRVFPEPFLERSVIQRKLAQMLLTREILLFHGSTVAVDGEAYLFTADCGTGKSTHTRFWREYFGDRAVMVNDDKPFLRFEGNAVLACGAPWSGKHGLDTNVSLPLKGVCILERGKENRICAISPEEALPHLIRQGGEPKEPALQDAYRALVKRLSENVPLWRMVCTRDVKAAQVSYAAMSGKKA